LYQADGTVDQDGTVGRYRLLLLSRLTRTHVAETMSDDAGAWTIQHLTNAHGYIAVALDYGTAGNADADDEIVLTAMSIPAF
jgi:hypothetical protein